MAQKKVVYLLALLYAFLIGFSFLFTKLTLAFASPVDTMAYRFTISFLLLGVPVAAGWIKLGLRGRQLWRLLPVGLVYPGLFFGLQAGGLEFATSSEGGIFQASAPIFTMLLAALFLKERTTWLQRLSVACSVAGVVFMIAMAGAKISASHIQGIVLLLASALMLSIYSVLARSLSRSYTPIQLTFAMMLFGFVSFAGLSIGQHAVRGYWDALTEPLSHPSFVWGILYIGILSSLVTALLSNYILSKIEASRMSVFVNLGTLMAILGGVVFLKETLAYYHIIGAAMIIAGVLGANIQPRKRKMKAASSIGGQTA
ncbi:DMT family transporter [Cohnella nanjingensis]|uniref:EamA family transporter n=1 Tax=Cohnella nanjingensis TaxID=1387779 RepID=A0A7X0VFT0_9BACL|nr:DMT family transporter [Cohnella nanjingensis]MBB6671603.1 EamA family transporter [Cohnella nanjingensis]